MSDSKKSEQPEKDIDTIIEDLRSVIQPNDHLGSGMMPGFAEATPYTRSTDSVQPDITPGEPSLAEQAEGSVRARGVVPGRGAIPVPAPPNAPVAMQQTDDRNTGAPLAEGLQGVAQAVDEQDKDLRTNYGAGTASEQGPPPEASEKSRRTMGGNTLR